MLADFSLTWKWGTWAKVWYVYSSSFEAAELVICSFQKLMNANIHQATSASKPITWQQWLTWWRRLAEVQSEHQDGGECCWSTGSFFFYNITTVLSCIGWQRMVPKRLNIKWVADCVEPTTWLMAGVRGLNGHTKRQEARKKQNKLFGLQSFSSSAVPHGPGLEWRKCKWRDREGELIMEYRHKQRTAGLPSAVGVAVETAQSSGQGKHR